MADVKKLVCTIIHFLQDQRTSNQLAEDQAESLEAAIQCLEAAYGIDATNEQTLPKFQVQRNLLDIFNAQLNIETDVDTGSPASHEAMPDEKEEAESLKNKGNDFMKAEQFSDALECYTRALKLDNNNAVYFYNRAAAYSKLSKHDKAIEDCRNALKIDPFYSKAYGRMGIAYTAIEDHASALDCYRKALELEPGNQSYQNNLEISEQKLHEMASQDDFTFSGGGGMPDFTHLLSNPGLVQMAQNMMSNPQMQSMMSNMMMGMGRGGGSDISQILQAGQQLAQQMQQQNPELVNQLRQQMGEPSTEDDPDNTLSHTKDQKPPGPGCTSAGRI